MGVVMGLPDQLMADFDACVSVGSAPGIDPYEVLHAILADVLDSAILAARTFMEEAGTTDIRLTQAIRASTEDYIANHYGEG
jgi:hypothetical protein